MSLAEFFGGGKKEETTPEIIVDAQGTTRNVITGVETPAVTPPPTLDLPGITPGLQEPTITINPQGDVKNVLTGEVQSSPQHVPDLNLPNAPTEFSRNSGGTQYYPQDARLDVETGTYEAKEGAQPAPSNVDLIVEIKENEREQKPKRWRQSKKVADSLKRLDETEKEDPFAEFKRQEAARQQEFAQEVQRKVQEGEEVARKKRHQEALDSNEKANRGIPANAPLSQAGQDFFKKQSIFKKENIDLNKSLQEDNLSFKPAIKIAKGEEGEERMMVTLTETGSYKVGFDELKEALGTKQVKEDGKVVITYLGGRKYNNGNPTYSQDIVLDAEQFAILEPFLDVVDKNREEITKDLRGESFQHLSDLMEPEEAQRYENSEKAREMEEEAEGEEETEKTEIDELREQIARLEQQIAHLTALVQQSSEIPIVVEEPPIIEPELPEPAEDSNSDELNEEELQALRGELTPEQQSLRLGEEIAELELLRLERDLTDAEMSKLLDLRLRKDDLDRNISGKEQESQEHRTRKEVWIRRVAMVAGFATALATPAISIPAVIAITLGGPLIAKYGIKKLEGKVRAKSTLMKYESRRGKSIAELEETDKRQKRAEWWANRLGETAAVLTGAAFGYGLGNLFEQVVLGGDAIGSKGIEKTMEKTISNTGPEQTGIDQTGINETGVDQTGIGNTEIPNVTEAPSWLGDGTFNASDLGWDYNRYGWLGDQIHLGATGGQDGIMQGEFFGKLAELVPQENLVGQTSGDIVNSFLVRAYNGMNPSMAAEKAAEVLLGQ